MTIYTVNKAHFELKNQEEAVIGSIAYSNTSFNEAVLRLEDSFSLQLHSTGVWITVSNNKGKIKLVGTVKVEAGGTMSVQKINKRKKYFFKKSANWKIRFSLFNKEGDELLTIIPAVNWEKGSHDFVLQLNEEFESECDSFLILQALHCANCSLSMMTGGKVPALVSI